MTLSAQQLEVRRTRIGSSEIGALLGIDPYKSAFDVFMEKSLPPAEGAPEDHRSWGLDMERSILENHARRNGFILLNPPGTLTHPEHPLCATPDGLGLRDKRARDIQAKNDQGFGHIEWGEPGTDDAPLLYVAQVTIEVGILLANPTSWPIDDTADLAVSIRGAPPVSYQVKFDPELFGNLAEIAAKWRRDHLQAGRPPDGTPMEMAQYVKRRWDTHNANMLEPTAELAALVQAVASLRSSRKALEEELTDAENNLKAAIGDAAGVVGLCTWKVQTRKAHTVKESTSRVLRLIATSKEDRNGSAEAA